MLASEATTPRRRFEGPLDLVGGYKLLRHIGRGGMADVYHARENVPGGRDVALKVLLPGAHGESEAIGMMIDEARIAGAVDHPNVVRLINAGRSGDDYYLALEYVEGGDLRRLLTASPKGLPVGQALDLTAQVAMALEAVHGAVDEAGQPREIVHRDVSAANVLIDQDGRARLGDFGIARARSRMTRTAVGVVKGKLRYLAPELLDGRVADHRCDLFSLGVLSFELFFGDDALKCVHQTPYGLMFAWPELLPHALPPPVEAMLRRLTSPDPALRHQSAAELLVELRALQAPPPVEEPEAHTSTFRRQKSRGWLMAVAVLIPTVATVLLALLIGTTPAPSVLVLPAPPTPAPVAAALPPPAPVIEMAPTSLFRKPVRKRTKRRAERRSTPRATHARAR